MKLTDMKHVPSKKKDKEKEMLARGPSPSYPYGLQLRLDNESLEKLGIDKLPRVGGTVTVTAEAKVTSVSQNESEGGSGMRRSCELQITKLGLEAKADKGEKGEKANAADALYATKK